MEMKRWVPPPGFRFHPTEEELVGYYLNQKINSTIKIDFDFIIDIDLYKMEPWDIQGQCKQVYNDEERNEWFFFSHKDRKYPSGTRTNRATSAGFWKATGRDKAVVSNNKTIGMRKTLVFYNGRAPNGRKTDWIIHEYKLLSLVTPPKEDGWVVCRAFKKATPNNHKQVFEDWVQTYNNDISTSQSFPDMTASTSFDAFVHQNECDQLLGAKQSLLSSNTHFDDNQLVNFAQTGTSFSYSTSTDLGTNEDFEIPKLDIYNDTSSMSNLLFQSHELVNETTFSYEPNDSFYNL